MVCEILKHLRRVEYLKSLPGCIVTLVKNALDPETLRHLDKHEPVIKVHYLFRIYLSEIRCNPEDVWIRFAIVDESQKTYNSLIVASLNF